MVHINFPDTFDNDTTLYRAVNNLRTTLTSDITASDTTIPVVTTSGYPTTGFISILTGADITKTEAIKYSSTVPTAFIGAARGADGTTALPHFTNNNVDLTIVADHHNALQHAVIELEHFLGVSGSENFLRVDDSGNVSVSGTLTVLQGQSLGVVTVADDIILSSAHHVVVATGVPGEAGFDPRHEVSLDLDTSEHLQSSSSIVNLGTTWTIGVWAKRTTTGNFVLFQATSGAGVNRTVFGFISNTQWYVELRSNTGATPAGSKQYESATTSIGGWHYYVATFDQGSQTFKLYFDGVEELSPILSLNNTVTQDGTGTSRAASVGARVGGGNNLDVDVYQTQIWDKVLSAAEVAALYVAGNPQITNIRRNFGNYTSASNLIHWWRHGKYPTNLGKDDGLSTPAVSISTSAVGVTSADIIASAPGQTFAANEEFLNVTLPVASGHVGREYIIANVSDGIITVTGTVGSEVVDHVVDPNTGSNIYISDGVGWRLVSTTSGVVTLPDPVTVASGIFTQSLTVSGVPVLTAVPDPLVLATGTFTQSLTVSGTPVLLESSPATVPDPLVLATGTFTQSLTISGVPVPLEGAPAVVPDPLVLATGTFSSSLTVSGVPVSTGTLTVRESDGSPAVFNVTTLVVTTGTLTDDGGGQVTLSIGGGGGGGGGVISRTVVYKNSVQTVTNNSLTPIDWEVEAEDDDGWWNLGSDAARATVPAGVSRVRVTAQIEVDDINDTGRRIIEVELNDASLVPRIMEEAHPPGTGVTSSGDFTIRLVSYEFAVSPGDTIRVTVLQNSGGNLGVHQSTNRTWLEIVGF